MCLRKCVYHDQCGHCAGICVGTRNTLMDRAKLCNTVCLRVCMCVCVCGEENCTLPF